MPTLRSRAMTWVTSRSPIDTVPAEGRTSPAMMRSIVDLPQPLGPRIAAMLPPVMEKLTSETAAAPA